MFQNRVVRLIVARSIRVGFLLTLGLGMLLSLMTYQANAQGTTPTQAPAKPNTASGDNVVGGAARLASNSGNHEFNAEDYIENFSEHIHREEREGRLGALSGREQEAHQILRALYGDAMNPASTVAMTGDPSIGKTTAMIQFILANPDEVVMRVKVEELAHIKVPAGSNPNQVRSAQATALQAVLLYMEQKTITATDHKPITYIDNLDALAEGSPGEVRPAGAITQAVSYKRKLRLALEGSSAALKSMQEMSASFKARTQVIELASPKFDQVMDYLRTYRSRIEGSTGVHLSESAIAEAARLSIRFDNNDPFRKAYAVLLHAAGTLRADQQANGTDVVRVNTQLKRLTLEIDSVQRDVTLNKTDANNARLTVLQTKKAALEKKLEGLKMPNADSSMNIADLRRDIEDLNLELKDAPSGFWAKRAGKEEHDRVEALIKSKSAQLLKLVNQQDQAVDPAGKPAAQLAAEHVQRAYAEFTGLDVDTISMDVRQGVKRIDEINDELFNVGHILKRAKRAISTYMKEKAIADENEANGIVDKSVVRKKPIWSVIIPGRTGTGKSDIAMRIAQKLGMPLLKIHMSSYNQSHGSSGLIGARAEYVGFGQDGELTGPVRRTPYILIMLDEIQRAHIEVIKTIVYPILDQGEIKDGQGRTVYFDNAIIMAPTNAGEEFAGMNRGQLIDFLKAQETHVEERHLALMTDNQLRSEAVKIALKVTYHWEESMIGRWDDVISSNDLTPEVVVKIAHKNVTRFAKLLASRKIQMKLSETAMDAIIGSFNAAEGARSIETFFKRDISGPIYEMWGLDEIKNGQTMVVDYHDGKFSYTPSETAHVNAVAASVKPAEAPVVVDQSASAKMQNELAKHGAEVAQAPVEVVHPFSEEYMIRNATAKALRRVRE